VDIISKKRNKITYQKKEHKDKSFRYGLWMAEFDKQKLIEDVLQTIINIISRRTSETYAAMVMNRIIRKMHEKHSFLKNIEIKNPQISEIIEIIEIKSDLNNIQSEEVGKFTINLINEITGSLGSSAGYYFIKEIKEEISSETELLLKNLGVDLDMMQLEYFTGKSGKHEDILTNSDVLKYVFKLLFDILELEQGMDFAYKTIDEIVRRFSTKYNILNSIKVNDIRTVHDIDIISFKSDVNSLESDEVGDVIQKIFQVTNNYLIDKDTFTFVETLQAKIDKDHAVKLTEMGVNINAISLEQGLIIKRLIKTLVEVLSDTSSENYAVMTLDNNLREVYTKYDALKYISIDSSKYSDGINAVSISSDIDSARPSEVGKGIQKLIEKVTFSLGEEAGKNFLNKLKKRLGKAYLLRIEEMGINLYIIELRYNVMW